MALKEELIATQSKLRARMAELRTQIAAVMAPAVPVWREVDALVQQHNEIGKQIADLTAKANALEQPMLHDLKMELGQAGRTDAALTQQIKAMGG